jgi:hypothetical protein
MSADVSDDMPILEHTMEVTCMECSVVERIGPLTRLTFTIPERVDKQSRRVVVLKLLVPTEMPAGDSGADDKHAKMAATVRRRSNLAVSFEERLFDVPVGYTVRVQRTAS